MSLQNPDKREKISEFISRLEKMKQEHGDVSIAVELYDTSELIGADIDLIFYPQGYFVSSHKSEPIVAIR